MGHKGSDRTERLTLSLSQGTRSHRWQLRSRMPATKRFKVPKLKTWYSQINNFFFFFLNKEVGMEPPCSCQLLPWLAEQSWKLFKRRKEKKENKYCIATMFQKPEIQQRKKDTHSPLSWNWYFQFHFLMKLILSGKGYNKQKSKRYRGKQEQIYWTYYTLKPPAI